MAETPKLLAVSPLKSSRKSLFARHTKERVTGAMERRQNAKKDSWTHKVYSWYHSLRANNKEKIFIC